MSINHKQLHHRILFLQFSHLTLCDQSFDEGGLQSLAGGNHVVTLQAFWAVINVQNRNHFLTIPNMQTPILTKVQCTGVHAAMLRNSATDQSCGEVGLWRLTGANHFVTARDAKFCRPVGP